MGNYPLPSLGQKSRGGGAAQRNAVIYGESKPDAFGFIVHADESYANQPVLKYLAQILGVLR